MTCATRPDVVQTMHHLLMKWIPLHPTLAAADVGNDMSSRHAVNNIASEAAVDGAIPYQFSISRFGEVVRCKFEAELTTEVIFEGVGCRLLRITVNIAMRHGRNAEVTSII